MISVGSFGGSGNTVDTLEGRGDAEQQEICLVVKFCVDGWWDIVYSGVAFVVERGSVSVEKTTSVLAVRVFVMRQILPWVSAQCILLIGC